MYLSTLESPFGLLTLAADETALTGLWFPGQKYAPAHLEGIFRPNHIIFNQTSAWLSAYFSRSALPPAPPLAPQGTEFQRAVWQQLLTIPYGETKTYGAIAANLRAAGRAAPAQAVGGAVGHNPISILIPCHRVIGANGSLTGYAGGINIKQQLLSIECNANHLYIY